MTSEIDSNSPHWKKLVEIFRDLNHPLTPIPTHQHKKLIPIKGVRSLLFDLYGTLFISSSGDIGTGKSKDRETALLRSLESTGFSGNLQAAAETGSRLLEMIINKSHESLQKKGIQYPEIDIRKTWFSVLEKLHEEGLITTPPKEELVPFEDLVPFLAVSFECHANPVWPMAGLKTILDQLRRKKLLLGIISNAQFFSPLLFHAFLGKSHEDLGFRQELCAWSYKFLEAKPSRTLFQYVLDHLKKEYGIAGHEVLYVGNDMLCDIWAASKFNLKTALFAGDKRSLRLRSGDPRVKEIKPDIVLTGLDQLNEVL